MYIKVDHPEKACLWCGCTFKPTTKHQNFCTRSCYKRYGKKYLGHSNGKSITTGLSKNKHRGSNSYRKHKKLFCESCGFVPQHPCQLDVDHIDGDHSNNNILNLQTLCANCHRLKTAIQLGWTK